MKEKQKTEVYIIGQHKENTMKEESLNMIIHYETPRLFVRQLKIKDIPAVYEMMRSCELAEKVGFKPHNSTQETEGFIHEGVRSGRFFGIAEKDHAADVIGILIFTPDEKVNGSVKIKTYEIGYFLTKNARGKGYMPEAVEGAKTYLFDIENADSLLISLFPWNNASRRVALKCGFNFVELKKEYGRTGLGKLEDLEFYTLSKTDYMNSKQASIERKVSIIIPGRVLSEGCPDVPVLESYTENGKQGLKDSDGNIVFPAVYDTIDQWHNADVVYTLKGDEFHYYNTKGVEILTDIEPLEGDEGNKMPYYISEEQGRAELMTFTLADGPIDNRCCYMNGRWIRLGRVLKTGVADFMGSCDVLPFERNAFSEFESPFNYIYAAFQATAQGDKAIEKCIDNLRLMGCYDSSWHYITKIDVNPHLTSAINVPASLFAFFETYLEADDMHRIGVNIDPSLNPRQIRIRQIRYFKDRWPLVEEINYREAVKKGTFSEMCSLRGAALSKIRELCRPDLTSAVIKDFLADETFPGNMYWTGDLEQIKSKIRQLKSYGCSFDDAIWKFAECASWDLCNPVEETLNLDVITDMFELLVSEGAHINHIRNMSTPLDRLNQAIHGFPDKQDVKYKDALQLLMDKIKEYGGLTMKQIHDSYNNRKDMPGLISVMYPWIKKNKQIIR